MRIGMPRMLKGVSNPTVTCADVVVESYHSALPSYTRYYLHQLISEEYGCTARIQRRIPIDYSLSPQYIVPSDGPD